jgi:PAS domain S-box-containing protein
VNPVSLAVAEGSRGAVDGITDAYCLLDEHWRIQAINQRALELFNRSKDELVGRVLWDAFLPAAGSFFFEQLHRAARERRWLTFDAQFPGRERWFETLCYPTTGGLAVFLRDIQARKLAEDALQMHSRALASMAEGVSIIDADGVIVYTNPAEERMFGYEHGELIGKPVTLQNAYPLEESTRLVADLITISQRFGFWQGEWHNRRKDGSTFYTEAHITAFTQADRTYWVCVQRDITKAKAAREALQRTERHLTELVESIGDHLVSFDRELRYTYVNEGAARRMGRAREQLVGKTLLEIFPDAIGNQYYRDLRRALLEQRNLVTEQYYAPWGVWFENHTYATADGVTVFTSNITHRKRAEQLLAEGETRLRLAQQAARIGTFEWDIQNGKNLWTPEMCALYGLDNERADGACSDWSEHIHPDDRARMQQEIQDALRSGQFDGEFRVVWPDSSVHWLHARALVYLDEQQQPMRMVGVNVDITERKLAEIAHLETEQRLRLAVSAGGVGVWEWNIVEDKIYWSEHIYDFYGLERKDFSHDTDGVSKLLHPDDRQRVSDAIYASMEQGAAYVIEYRIVRPSGEVRWISTNGQVVRDAAGRPVLMIGASIDSTERRALEDALRAHADELAEQAKRKDEFLAMLAHELRNPLASILNASEILKLRGAEDAFLARQQAIIERQGRHLALIIDDLLDVARVTRGKIDLRRSPVDLVEAVRQAIQTCESKAQERQHQLIVAIPDGAATVEGDFERLVQIIVNLLNNAIKYTPRGGRIELTLTVSNEHARVSVRDNGQGIDASVLPHIFELFVQGDQSLHRTEGGLGIGLTLVESLVHAHGGTVEVHSAGVGEGSEFVITLPEFTQREPSSSDDRRSQTPKGPPRRVLVVDDNVDAADGLKMILELSGHEVMIAYNGRAALELVGISKPEIVLLDIGLPELDGYSVALQMRKLDPEREMLLVALTGYGREQDRERAMASGFDHHLVKPIHYDALHAIIPPAITPLRGQDP